MHVKSTNDEKEKGVHRDVIHRSSAPPVGFMVEVSGGATERVREVVDQVRERKFPYVRRSRRRIPW